MRPLQKTRELYRKSRKKQEKIDAMGLATLRRRPALSRKIPRAVGIFLSILVPYAPILEIKIPRTSLGIVYFLERAMGLEPTTAAMARRYSSQLSYAREQEIYYRF
jgi:hypothetical protein